MLTAAVVALITLEATAAVGAVHVIAQVRDAWPPRVARRPSAVEVEHIQPILHVADAFVLHPDGVLEVRVQFPKAHAGAVVARRLRRHILVAVLGRLRTGALRRMLPLDALHYAAHEMRGAVALVKNKQPNSKGDNVRLLRVVDLLDADLNHRPRVRLVALRRVNVTADARERHNLLAPAAAAAAVVALAVTLIPHFFFVLARRKPLSVARKNERDDRGRRLGTRVVRLRQSPLSEVISIPSKEICEDVDAHGSFWAHTSLLEGLAHHPQLVSRHQIGLRGIIRTFVKQRSIEASVGLALGLGCGDRQGHRGSHRLRHRLLIVVNQPSTALAVSQRTRVDQVDTRGATAESWASECRVLPVGSRTRQFVVRTEDVVCAGVWIL